jgi:hypothetical protein
MYGASDVAYTKSAERDLKTIEKLGYAHLPVCIAKTQNSLSDDPKLRGTALEYLEGVLPQDLSQRLWPFLGREQQAPRDVRARDQILADLLRSNESIMLNLEELRKRVDKGA